MLGYVAHNSERFEKTINPAIFERTFDKPLHMFVVETCRNLNAIPGLSLESWELVTDQSKIDNLLNRKTYKDKNIKKNKSIERLVTTTRTDTDLLKLTFKKDIDGIVDYVERSTLILHQDDNGYYTIGGKKRLPLIQIVDISTYVLNDILNFKTLIVGLKLKYKTIKLKTSEGDMKNNMFILDLFTKEVNPLLYYLAEMGFIGTLEYFDFNEIIAITSEQIDKEHYLYTNLPKKGMYLEIDKRFLKNDFIATFYAGMVDCLSEEVRLERILETEYWLEVLSEKFGKRLSRNGKKILISFRRIMDKGTLGRLKGFKPRNRKNSFTVVRYLMQNYDSFMKKDNHDLENKRIRSNEALASHFEMSITKNINSLLGDDKITSERIDKLLNAINEKSFIRAANNHDLFRYERYNDFDAINLSRYSFKGPSGINGNKYEIAPVHRNIYPSHYGRLDYNVCSASNPGLTGYLTANVKLYNDSFFSDRFEPDEYSKEIRKLNALITSTTFSEDRMKRMRFDAQLNEEGKIVLKRRVSREESLQEVMNDPEKYGLYKTLEGKLILMKLYKMNKKEQVVLTRRQATLGLDPKKFKFNQRGQLILDWREGKHPSEQKTKKK